MANAKFLTSIVELRKKFPKSKLGNREKSLLDAKGSRVAKDTEYNQGVYRVRNEEMKRFFSFTYKHPNYADFTIVG